VTAAHDQHVTHRYVVHYPDHAPRTDDPHYADFEAYRRRTHSTARCAVAVEVGDDSDCDREHPLELHHAHIEFALANEVELSRLERVYPGVSTPNEVGAWIETAANLEWLCRAHHRGPGGVHTAAAADFEAAKFVRGLIT
jgi:hypothetical protein